MNKQRIALIIASGLGILAIFMPWVNIPLLGSISGKEIPDDKCWLPSIIFAIPLIIALLGDRTKPLLGNFKYAAFVPGLINAIIGIMIIARFEEIKRAFLAEIVNKAGAFLGKNVSGFLGGSVGQAAEQALNAISIGIGVYLIIIAGIGVCSISLFAKWFGKYEEPAEENDVLHLLADKFKHLPAGKRKLVIISLVSLALLIGIIWIAFSKQESVKIGEQVWMAKNLNIKIGNSVCYDNDSANCKKYGRLYDWATAMKACPKGWHLPSDKDWNVLMKFVNPSCSDNSDCEGAGTKLKATSGWNSNGNGTDKFGFSALPGGYGNSDGNFDDAGSRGRWWSSSEYNAYAYRRSMHYSYENAYWSLSNKSYLQSVRCLQD